MAALVFPAANENMFIRSASITRPSASIAEFRAGDRFSPVIESVSRPLGRPRSLKNPMSVANPHQSPGRVSTMKLFVAAGLLAVLAIQLSGAAEYCYWDGTSPNCMGQCPSGFVERGRHKSGDGRECWTGTKAKCCMTTLVAANCRWVGTAPFCVNAECPEGFREIARDRSGDGSNCWTGTKLLCCSVDPFKTISNVIGSII